MAKALLKGFCGIGLILFILVHYSPSAFSAVLSPTNGVQRGTATLAVGSSITTVSINPVNLDQSILWFQVSHNIAAPNNGSVSGQITNSTTLTFSRVGTSNTVTIQWYVTQFSSGVSVQRGTTVKTGTPTMNVPINPVDLTLAFVLISDQHSGGTYNASTFTRARLTSSTNLELSVVGTTTTTPDIVEWQVVEIQSGASVQSGLVSFGTTASTVNVPISTVNPASSFLVFNYRSATGTGSNIGQKMVRGRIISNTQLTFDRAATGQAIDIAWYVVSWTDGTTVQSGSTSFTSTQTVNNVTISPVNSNRTITFSGTNQSTVGQAGGSTSYTTNDNPGVAAFRHVLTTSTNLQLTRVGTGGTTTSVGWFVIQFSGPQPPANLIAADTPGDMGGSISLLNWTVSPSPDVTEQRIYRSTTSGGPYTTPVAVITDNVTSSYVDNSGLTNGTPYYYVLRAYDGFNESVNSNEANAIPLNNLPPVITTTNLSSATVGGGYSRTLAVIGGISPLTWSIVAGSLPAGLTLNGSTGVISGVPTTAETLTFSVQVTDANNSNDIQALSITVNPTPVLTTTSLSAGNVGAAYYNESLAVSGGTTPLIWSVFSGTLPPGLSLSTGGVISGTPTTSGTSNFTVRVTDANGVFDDQALSIIVSASLTITTTTMPGATIGIAYTRPLSVSGGTVPLIWSIVGGTLPSGLSLNSSTGAISGAPTMAGISNFTVRVTDATSTFDDQTLTIVVNAVPVVTTTTLSAGTVGQAYSQILTGSGGTTPLTWSVVVGTLPASLALNSNTGVISGIPASPGTSNFTVRMADAYGVSDDQVLTIVVNSTPGMTITTTSLLGATLTAAYSQTLTATGGIAPFTWSIQTGTLPAGLSLNSNTGVIGGTLTSTGTYNFTVRVTDANFVFDDQVLSLMVSAAPVVTTTTLPVGVAGAAYIQTLAAIGGTSPLTWSLFSGTLPAGLSLSNGGLIFGMPTSTGTSNFTIRVTDAYGMSDNQALSMAVQAQSTQAAALTHSPMLGAATDTTIKIWVRASGLASASIQYQPAGGDWSQALNAGPVNLIAGNDFTGVVPINGLSPASLYDYRVALGGIIQSGSTSVFRTLPPSGTGSQITLVFGADIHQSYQPHYLFDRMAARQPDFAILMGDQMYADLFSGTEMDFWNAYRNNRDLSFQNFAKRIPIFATWDDHDYGNNDEDQFYPLKAQSRAAFGKYWANPAYVELDASIYYKFLVGDTEFYMLDTRWNRNPGVTMLGAAQLQWLKDQLLVSTARFKFIVSSVPWNDFTTTGNDSWVGFQVERSDLFQFIVQNNIKNIILLSGDQHWSGAFLINFPTYQIGHNTQGFYEFSPTPLSAFTFPAPSSADPQVLFLEDIGLNYGLIRIDSTVTPSQLQFEIHRGSDDSAAYSLTVQEFTTPSLTILTSSLQDADWGNPYSQSLRAVGGTPPYQWRLMSGNLPSGLMLDPAGFITGTPTQLGTFSFTVQVQDPLLSTDSRTFTLTVNGPPLLVEDFSSGVISGWTIVDEGTNSAPSAWAVSNGQLVQSSNIYGGSASGSDPVKPGTYIYTGDHGWTDYEFRVRLMSQGDDDALGVMFRYQDGQNYYRFSMDRERAYRRLTKTVGGITTILAQDTVAYQMNRWYDVKVRVVGSQIQVYLDDILLFSVVDGSLPAGSIALYCWGNQEANFDQIVVTPLSFFIATTSFPAGEKGISYSKALKGAGGLPPYTWSLISGTLPDGLTLNATGEIAGIPTRIGTFEFTVQLTDQEFTSKTKTFSLIIRPQSLFKDGFEGSLAPWTVVDEGTTGAPSNWAIINSVLVQTSNIYGGSLDGTDPVKPGTYIFAGGTGWTDYDFSLSLKSTDDDGIGVMFRYQDSQNYYRFSMDQERAFRRLTKTVSGVVTILAQDNIRYTVNQSYAVEIRVIGNRIQIQLDGILLFDALDNSIPSGKIALYCWGGQNCYFDDVLVSHTTPRIMTTSFPNGIVSRPYNQTLDVSGGVGPYNWNMISGSLPSGLTLGLSGIISGTPDTIQVSGFTVQVNDGEGSLDSKPFSITIAPIPPPNVITTSLPEGTVGTYYNQILNANEGIPPYQWSVVSGQLPPGLSLTTFGELLGTPTQSGIFNVTVRVEDTTAQSDTQLLAISISPVPLVNEEFNGGLSGWTIVDEGTNMAPSAWAVTNGQLVQSSNIYGGSTSGTDPVKPGTFIYTGDAGWTDYELRVQLMSQNDDDGLGVMFRHQDGQNYYRFSMDQERAYRRLTKTAGGVTTILAQDAVAYQMNRWYEVNVRAVGSQIQVYLDGILLFDVSDSSITSGSIALYCWANQGCYFDQVKVYPLAFTIAQTNLPAGEMGAAYSYNLAASGGAQPYTWSLVSGSLPQGLTLNSSGLISGTPTVSGVFGFTVTVQDQQLKTDSKPINLTIQSVILLRDDFSGGFGNWTIVDEGTNNVPSAWAVTSGQLVQSSNIFGGSTDGSDPVKPGTYVHAGNVSWMNYEFSVRLRSSDDDGLGIMFRYQNGQNYYRFSIDRERAYRRLVKVVNGTTTILAQDTIAYAMNQWYDIKVIVVLDHIQVYLNGALLFGVMDPSITSGKIALYSWGNANSYFDDVWVTQK